MRSRRIFRARTWVAGCTPVTFGMRTFKSQPCSLETIGFYSDAPGSQKYPPVLSLFYPNRGNFIGFVGNPESRDLVRRSVRRFRESIPFPSEGIAAPSEWPGVGWSDHWPNRFNRRFSCSRCVSQPDRIVARDNWSTPLLRFWVKRTKRKFSAKQKVVWMEPHSTSTQ